MFSLKNVKMKPKLISLFLIAGIVPIVIVGFFSSFKAQKSLIHDAHNQLTSVREIKKQDKATSVVWGMPGAVAEAGDADEIHPEEKIAPRIMQLVKKGR